MFERWSDAIAGGFLLLVSLFFTYSSAVLPQSQMANLNLSTVPLVLGFAMSILSSVLLVQGLRKAKALEGKTSDKPIFPRSKVLVISAILMAFCGFTFESLGFVVASSVYLFLQGWILADKGTFKPVSMAAFALGAPLVIYYVFGTWFSMTLPQGILRYLYV